MTRRREIIYWVAGFAAFIFLLYILRGMLFPFLAGMAVAYFLDPATDKLESWGWSRTLATTAVSAVFTLIIIAVLLVLLPLLQSQVFELARRIPIYAEVLREQATPLLEVLRERVSAQDLEQIRDAAGGIAGEALRWVGDLLSQIWSGGLALFNVLSLVFVAPIVGFYLLRDWDRITAKIDSWLPRDHAETIRAQAREIDKRLAGFIRGQAVVCIILATYYGIGLTWAGLDFGLIVGLGSGIISFIPYVGALVGFTVGVGLAFLQFTELLPVGLVALVFVIGQTVEGNFLTPKLVGDQVGLHPVWIIFALFACGTVFGFVGVLLAIPLAAVIGVLGRFALDRYLHSELYGGGDDAPRPGAP